MKTRWLDGLCFWICIISLLAWLALSCVLIWLDLAIPTGTRRSFDDSIVWKSWLTSQAFFIVSALILRLNRTYGEGR